MANSFYSNARAKYLSNNLLGNDRLKRMIESNLDDAIKVLQEVNFGSGVSIQSSFEFEKILYAEEKALLSFVRSSSPSDSFKKFFLSRYDFHNAEALIKAKHLKIDSEKMLVCHGLIESSFLAEKILKDDYRFFPKTMENALKQCDYLFVSGKATGDIIGNIIRKALYQELNIISKNSAILKEFLSFSADMQNVSFSLRSKDFSLTKEYYLDGGEISLNELKFLCGNSFETITERIKFMPNGNIIDFAVKCSENGLPFSDFEKFLDCYNLKKLNEKKYSTDGIIPFALYCYEKLNEIKNVRIILVGLLNNLDKKSIEGRLRNTYEG